MKREDEDDEDMYRWGDEPVFILKPKFWFSWSLIYQSLKNKKIKNLRWIFEKWTMWLGTCTIEGMKLCSDPPGDQYFWFFYILICQRLKNKSKNKKIKKLRWILKK